MGSRTEKEREKQKVKLLDTSGKNEVFALRISMPTEDYRPLVIKKKVDKKSTNSE